MSNIHSNSLFIYDDSCGYKNVKDPFDYPINFSSMVINHLDIGLLLRTIFVNGKSNYKIVSHIEANVRNINDITDLLPISYKSFMKKDDSHMVIFYNEEFYDTICESKIIKFIKSARENFTTVSIFMPMSVMNMLNDYNIYNNINNYLVETYKDSIVEINEDNIMEVLKYQ